MGGKKKCLENPIISWKISNQKIMPTQFFFLLLLIFPFVYFLLVWIFVFTFIRFWSFNKSFHAIFSLECSPFGVLKIFEQTFKINLLSDSAKLKGCTVIDGNLEIEMRKGTSKCNKPGTSDLTLKAVHNEVNTSTCGRSFTVEALIVRRIFCTLGFLALP